MHYYCTRFPAKSKAFSGRCRPIPAGALSLISSHPSICAFFWPEFSELFTAFVLLQPLTHYKKVKGFLQIFSPSRHFWTYIQNIRSSGFLHLSVCSPYFSVDNVENPVDNSYLRAFPHLMLWKTFRNFSTRTILLHLHIFPFCAHCYFCTILQKKAAFGTAAESSAKPAQTRLSSQVCVHSLFFMAMSL